MSLAPCLPKCRNRGFTLIEVVGALMIFSVGVLMVIQVSGALGTQMRYAAIRSEIAVRAGESVDSLTAVSYVFLADETRRDTLVVGGLEYERVVQIMAVSPVLSKLEVSLAPVAGVGPTHSVTAYSSNIW